ncbi:HAD family hydrolase [Streptomyces nitrosporeus]|uniref:HAD family hydrolase n=1 Tax=Streptomyces nitrosporeus TaxID=28894 RepID=UPI0039A3A445
MSLDLIVFDYSEVLSRNQPDTVVAALEEAAGVPPERFWEAWHRHRPAYNTTASAADYWQLVADDLGADWDTAHRQRLWDTDIGNCLNPHEPTLRIVRRLHGKVPLVLLSDAPSDLARCLDGSPGMALFDHLFFSCDIAVNKPDPQAYRTVLRHTGAQAGRTLFIDDKRVNTEAAARLGLRTHHYTSAEDLDRYLARTHGL